jgi:hypothetical protein
MSCCGVAGHKMSTIWKISSGSTGPSPVAPEELRGHLQSPHRLPALFAHPARFPSLGFPCVPASLAGDLKGRGLTERGEKLRTAITYYQISRAGQDGASLSIAYMVRPEFRHGQARDSRPSFAFRASSTHIPRHAAGYFFSREAALTNALPGSALPSFWPPPLPPLPSFWPRLRLVSSPSCPPGQHPPTQYMLQCNVLP